MLHQGTVALLLPFGETLQLVTKELLSGKRGSLKQRSDRQCKKTKNSKDNESERKQKWQLEEWPKKNKKRADRATHFKAYFTSSLVGENRYAGATNLEVNLAFEVQNWTAGDICQSSLCVMWVLLIN